MASRRGIGFGFGFHSKPNYIYPATETAATAAALRRPDSSSDNLFEFDEADIWTSGQTPPLESRKIFPISKKLPKRSSGGAAAEKAVKASSSLPVNIPDWSKILQSDQSKQNRREAADEDFDDSENDDDDIRRAPPHEYLARRRGDSLSVHEGIGRTLKGRDLRMVRNAIWEKTGFED